MGDFRYIAFCGKDGNAYDVDYLDYQQVVRAEAILALEGIKYVPSWTWYAPSGQAKKEVNYLTSLHRRMYSADKTYLFGYDTELTRDEAKTRFLSIPKDDLPQYEYKGV